MEDSPPPSPGSHIVQANPQIAAALAVSPMHQPNNAVEPNNAQFVNQPMGMAAGPGGPMRMGPPPMQHQVPVRPMPYPPPQMRQGPPAGPPNYPPMSQQQFQPNHQMRPQMPNQGMPMGGFLQPGPSHPMGMGQHMQGPPQFQQNQMVHPPMGHMQPHPPNPMTIQSSGPLGAIMDKSKLDDLMAQISSTTVLEESVKDVLVEYADDFVSGIIDRACRMLRNREVKKIEGRDIEFILKNIYNMPVVPRSATHIFGVQSDMVDTSRDRHVPTEAHKQRVALLKRQLKKV